MCVRERDITVDEPGFEAAMAKQRSRAQAAGQFNTDYNDALVIEADTDFCGYTDLSLESEVIGIFQNGQEVESVTTGSEAVIVLKQTPFYAESGGQCG